MKLTASYRKGAFLCAAVIAALGARPGCATPSTMYRAAASVKLPIDPSYWNGSGAGAATAGSAPTLDLFGSPADIENASTSAGPAAPANAAALANGVLTVNLTHSGLNIVDIAIPPGTVLSGIAAITADGASPTGLVLNAASNALVFKSYRFNLGGLRIGQVLINFGAGDVMPLSALSYDISPLAPLSAVSFNKNNVNGALAPDYKTGAGQPKDAAFAAPLPAYAITGGGAATAMPRRAP